MTPFSLENLKRVNRVKARFEPEQMFETEEGIFRHQVMYISLYADGEQVALGAERQHNNAGDGEFTTNRSGLRLALKFLEEISGMKFKLQPLGEAEEHHRNDLTVIPFTRPGAELPE